MRATRLAWTSAASLAALSLVASCVVETEPPPRKPLLRDTYRARSQGAAASASPSPSAAPPASLAPTSLGAATPPQAPPRVDASGNDGGA